MAAAPDDLIVAPATPAGRGALAVVRVTGDGSLALAQQLAGRASFTPRKASRVRLTLGAGLSEDAVVTTFVGPGSFTGQDSVEFSVHGSPIVVESLIDACVRAGARLAGPGEFSYRAHLNGKLDLLQAEAVADLVAATTLGQARVASAHLDGTLSREIVELGDALASLRMLLEASLDFPDEGFHFIECADVVERLSAVQAGCARLLATAATGRRVHEGAIVAIAGRPNAGKSSLFNALVGRPRAIVTPIAGTTRDLLIEPLDIGGVPVRLVDTAGLRESRDLVEAEGIARAAETMAAADVVVFVVDGTAGPEEQVATRTAWEDVAGPARRLVAVSKADLWREHTAASSWWQGEAVATSSVEAGGLADLEGALQEALADLPVEGAMLTRARHRSLVSACAAAVARAMETAGQGGSEEYVLADVHEALSALATLRGVETPDDVLREIFSSFCIGK